MDMTYEEAIEQVMRDNGGFASLQQIYNDIWAFKDRSKIVGKTPHNTIQERVQRSKKFFRIGLGVYGLSELKNTLLIKEPQPNNKEQKIEKMHARIQGMLIEIGNIRGFDTYTNDKSWIFDGKKLGMLSSLKNVPAFTYQQIIDKNIAFCDVVWFSGDEFLYPTRICEVEHSTDFRDALLKFKELEFFNSEFYCISTINRKDKFEREVNRKAFDSIKSRVSFLSYDDIISAYEYERRKINFQSFHKIR